MEMALFVDSYQLTKDRRSILDSAVGVLTVTLLRSQKMRFFEEALWVEVDAQEEQEVSAGGKTKLKLC